MQRLKEPSTWAGLAGILQAAKALVPVQYHPVVDFATAAAGVVAGMVHEGAGS